MSTKLRAYREDDDHVGIVIQMGDCKKEVKLTNTEFVNFICFHEEICIGDTASKPLEKTFAYHSDVFRLEGSNVRKYFLDKLAESMDEGYLMVESSLRVVKDEVTGIVKGTITGIKK